MSFISTFALDEYPQMVFPEMTIASTGIIIFSLVNTFVKPLATLISLPLIILTLGFFSLLVNVAMVALAIWIFAFTTKKMSQTFDKCNRESVSLHQ